MPDRTQEYPDGALPVPGPGVAEEAVAAIEILETDIPARRFYANMADL